LASRSERIRQYLGCGRVSAAPLSVWAFAGVLTMPAGWAAALVGAQYAYVLGQARRDKSGIAYRVVFSAAVMMWAQLAAAGVIAAGGARGLLHGQALAAQVLASAAVLAAVFVFTSVNLVILLAGMWLSVHPPSVRAMLPAQDAVGYELATLMLGIAAAEFLLHAAPLIPVMLVLIAFLHRSSVVKALQHAARTDLKTGLLNAAAWTERANEALSRSARTGRPLAVLVLDIDHFKQVNDTHGHLCGDDVLVAVAACLRQQLRGHDMIGRFGGDEFVAVLEELTPAAAEQVSERLRTAISNLRVGDAVSVRVSIGLAHAAAAEGDSTVQPLLERADAALNRPKASGRNRLRTSTPHRN
jgi:diguanylate cyclase (GGDEF)-like protein